MYNGVVIVCCFTRNCWFWCNGVDENKNR